MHIGDEIREARERVGITQADLAKRVGVDVKTVNNWETGKTSPRGKLGRVRKVLASDGPVLRAASDAELLAEIARRFERGKAGGEHERSAPNTDDDSGGGAVVDIRPEPKIPPGAQEVRAARPSKGKK